MIRDRLERIRERAYALWERAGGGHGEDEAHWHQASREIDDEDTKPVKPVKGASRKSASKVGAAGQARHLPARREGQTGNAAKPDLPAVASAQAKRGAKAAADSGEPTGPATAKTKGARANMASSAPSKRPAIPATANKAQVSAKPATPPAARSGKPKAGGKRPAKS